MFFTVKNKKGFKSKSPVVVIYKSGKPFYANTNKGDALIFNLPKGKYELVTGQILPLAKPFEYEPVKYIGKKRNDYIPSHFKVRWGNNPNKLSISLERKEIFIDNRFKNEPEIVLRYTLGHELGHHCFRGNGQVSEKDCDAFSANTMLIEGYNPSQIAAAIHIALSSGMMANFRKEHLSNILKNTYNG